ncbi:MAG: hypothetical protein IH870_05440 [Chloroflexi bacterium]|nr:hypothetical protein [Chloroflexota bacterium]
MTTATGPGLPAASVESGGGTEPSNRVGVAGEGAGIGVAWASVGEGDGEIVGDKAVSGATVGTVAVQAIERQAKVANMRRKP